MDSNDFSCPIGSKSFLVQLLNWDLDLDLGNSISSLTMNTGKYGPEKTPYLDTFHAVMIIVKYNGKFEIITMKTLENANIDIEIM